MDVAAPAPPDLPPPPGSVAPPPPPATAERILGGVAGLLAARLGLDPLWARLAFVLLALAGGLGLIVYAGLWLTLVVGANPERTVARYAGGALIVVGVPLALNASSFTLVSGPLAVIGLLVGLTLALWQPQPDTNRRAAATVPAPQGHVVPDDVTEEAVRRGGRRRFALPPLPPRRPRSVLGRATLGLAIVTAAVGALIDEANGNRLHPEQWLGAAAAVCGLGLLVGAVRGHARLLVVPAVAFAASGFVAGVAADVGADASDVAGGRRFAVYAETPPGPFVEEVAFGTIHLEVAQAPVRPTRVIARVGIGSVRVTLPADVTVEVRGRLDDGVVRVDGVAQSDDAVIVGPDGEPDVVVDAQIERGSVHVTRYDFVSSVPEPEFTVPMFDPGLGSFGELQPVADGVAATNDGWIVLAGGEAVISADDQVVVGDWYSPDESSTVIETSWGEYRLLPRSILLGPTGEVLDLAAFRDGLGARGDDADPTTATTAGGS